MTQPMDRDSVLKQIEQARAALEETQAAIEKVESRMHATSSKVRSRDRSVEVEVGARGDLLKIRFLENKYRTMSANQLADSVLEAIGNARSRQAQQVIDAYKPIADEITELPGISDRINWDGIFGPLEETAKGGASKNAGSRLHDEIHEDDEPSASQLGAEQSSAKDRSSKKGRRGRDG
ncbi:YbaB/EbfC family nucleoid-associated protein [Streptomyces sp. NPDC020681]|uniref:YbaB/EbfC family nucleoid-associated protein n=1 Tax=Streptomyces sp. NPDC020681 TaxID=3365083 RepID=UPI0037A721F8